MALTKVRRHPELVSGSIQPSMLSYRRQPKPDCQIMPIRVFAFDQIDFPLPVPAFELFLSRDGCGHVAENFITDEAVDGIAAGKSVDCAIPVLPQPRNQIAGDADIERPVRLAGKDIDARVALNRHGAERDEEWILKQVQGDAITESSSPPRHAEFISASIVPMALIRVVV